MCRQTVNTYSPPNPAQAVSGQPTSLSTSYEPKAPQLSVAINTSPVPEPIQQDLPVDAASTITAILKQIHSRLTGGLSMVWDGPDGHDPEWEPKTPEDSKHYPSGICRTSATMVEEEAWARACSELLVGASYGTSSMYGATVASITKPGTTETFSDASFYKTFWTDNPVYPIVMACQQLCTYALLIRGYTTHALSDKNTIGVSAGPNDYLSIFQGRWDTSSNYQNIAKAFGRKKGGLTPGSLFGFQPSGPGQGKGSHVVFVLRACPSKGRVQFLDTGAARADKGLQRAPGVNAPYSMADLGYNGNYDDQLFGGDVHVNIGSDVPYKGFGALLPPDGNALMDGVNKSREARPGGLARLAIFRRGGGLVTSKNVVYISPLLQMHEADRTANYTNARYLWSLREMPGCKSLSALWILSVPQHEFAGQVLTAKRDRPLAEIWKGSDSHPMSSSIWFTVDPDGCTRVYRRHKTESYLKADGTTDNRDAWEGKLDPLKAITTMMEQLAPGIDYVDPSFGKLDIPPYFNRW
jgi:hypothetical protein